MSSLPTIVRAGVSAFPVTSNGTSPLTLLSKPTARESETGIPSCVDTREATESTVTDSESPTEIDAEPPKAMTERNCCCSEGIFQHVMVNCRIIFVTKAWSGACTLENVSDQRWDFWVSNSTAR